ncbi:MAG: DUF4388 domain-containing protein [Kofleriaceae bacterium]
MDPDKLSSMIASRAIASSGCNVEVVHSGLAALELVAGRQVEMIIVEAQLADVPLSSLVSRLRQLYTPMIPVLVLATELRPAQRVDVLRLGAELMSKPFDAAELQARVERALARPKQHVDDAVTLLSGELGTFTMFDALTMLDLARFEGKLDVASARETGCVFFRGGRPYHATWGKASGGQALAAMLHLARGWFRARPGSTSTSTLEGSTTHLLLAATVDEAHRRRTPSAYPNRLDELGVTKRPLTPLTTRADGAERLARRLALQLHDPLRLGELDLADPHQAANEPDTLTLVMFGEVPSLIAALWEVSAPVSPETLIGCMNGRRLTWSFSGRDRDRLLVVPIGIAEPTPAWFELRPDIVVLAPPPSSVLALDPAVRPYVLHHGAPALLLAPPGAQRAMSPVPFTTFKSMGKHLHELRGQSRSVLADALGLVGSDS